MPFAFGLVTQAAVMVARRREFGPQPGATIVFGSETSIRADAFALKSSVMFSPQPRRRIPACNAASYRAQNSADWLA